MTPRCVCSSSSAIADPDVSPPLLRGYELRLPIADVCIRNMYPSAILTPTGVDRVTVRFDGCLITLFYRKIRSYGLSVRCGISNVLLDDESVGRFLLNVGRTDGTGLLRARGRRQDVERFTPCALLKPLLPATDCVSYNRCGRGCFERANNRGFHWTFESLIVIMT